MDQPGAFQLDSRLLGPLPVINAFLERLGVAGLLEAFLPHDDARAAAWRYAIHLAPDRSTQGGPWTTRPGSSCTA